MQKPDGEQASSSNPKLSPPGNGGAAGCSVGQPPQQLRKSRTISGSSPAAFQGPMSPPVGRVSTSPLPPRPLTLATHDPVEAAHGAGVLDRDWCYPSLLGGSPSRPRPPAPRPVAGVGSSSRPRPAPLRPELGVGPGPEAVFPQTRERPVRTGSRDDKETDRVPVKSQPKPADSALTSSSGSADLQRRSLVFRNSLIVNLLTATCLSSIFLVSSLRAKVARLEEEIANLRSTRSSNDFVGRGSSRDAQYAERSFYPLSYIDSRNIALATVLVALATPFVLYKFIDHIPYFFSPSLRSRNTEEEVPLKKRLAYRVDVFFSVYPYAKLLALLFATMLLIAFGGLALYAVTEDTFFEAMWLSWTFVADAGNHTDQVGIRRRIVSVSISAGGMLIFAMMLGLVSDAISEKVDSLRKGKSEVIERGHVLILGWSDKLGSLLKQLAIANKSLGGGVVVVLAERDKEEMEIDIGKLEFDFMGTSVICRSGSPLILADLKKVSVSKARAIIVLASDENPDQSDARALRVVLSLTGVKEGLSGHVVVEMSDLDNEPLVKLVGGEIIETVVAHDVIGRLMIQCALQPGLAQIWEDILGFENAEFYIKRWPQLDGMRFDDVHFSFADAVPCGVKIAAENGKIKINPDDDYVLTEGDEVLVIAEDDDSYAPGPLLEIRKDGLPDIVRPPKYPEKILFCGWRRDIDDMIMVLETFLAPGSELWLLNEVPEAERGIKLTEGGLRLSELKNIQLVHREGNAVIRRHLESLPLESFDSILILADEAAQDSIVHSDSRSLATLLLIRDIQSKRLPSKQKPASPSHPGGFSHSSWVREMQQASNSSIIISEILDSRTRNLVSVSRISDYVLSNELVSMALAMVAEDKQINRVLEELFAEEGNELYIRPAEFYLYDQEELSFFEIMARGRQRQEIVIGFRAEKTDKAVINPSDKRKLRRWSINDVFVVISYSE